MLQAIWMTTAGVLTATAGPPPVTLFDGTSSAAWQHLNGTNSTWAIDERSMIIKPGSGSLMTKELFGSARIHIEFLIPDLPLEQRGQSRGNSGVYIQNAYEVQILDSSGVAPAANLCGAIYGEQAPVVNAAIEAGAWQVYDIDFAAPVFDADGTKIKNAIISVIHNGVLIHDAVVLKGPTGAAKSRPEKAMGPIVLQDHGSAVQFRNIWVMPQHENAGPIKKQMKPIFDGTTFDGWEQRGGKAVYEVRDGTIVGETRPGQPNSFMCSTTRFSDFELDLAFKVDNELNSGVQIRSDVRESGRGGTVFGYQVEIDPSDRSWTGGLYEESGRGWLNPLGDNEQARNAFRPNEWNHMHVVAKGHHIRTWINGVPAANIVDDDGALEGFIGLQVHGVGGRQDPLQVRWKDITLRSIAPASTIQD